ncbi:MAG: site-specific DNA-methyltransferase [candidate division Zixibacteria bacterium]|nr:site-specific DNA-methyltransferase [candidate division Zixibacteria bacterium]
MALFHGIMLDISRARPDLSNPEIIALLLPSCRLKPGEIWCDPEGKHVVGCGDAADSSFIELTMRERCAVLAIQDPPYNLVMFETRSVGEFITWCRRWIDTTNAVLADDASLYIWLGADQNNHFQPLPQFIMMMAQTDFNSQSYITMRNQRGYGTQKNWMAVRQELLCYTKGRPCFHVQYTDIPRILRGYYKEVRGVLTENTARGRSDCIRPGNVWVDIQQVFYRMRENVNGCPAQKPLKSIERLVLASSNEGDTVVDSFAHSGTTLIACERLNRRCVTVDLNPLFAEITIRRLERFREIGETGWQRGHPFELELDIGRERCTYATEVRE